MQKGVDNPEVEQRYRAADRLRDGQSGQVGRYRVRTGKGQKPEGREKETREKQELKQNAGRLEQTRRTGNRQKTQVYIRRG